ncbi:hypothetical protein KAU32_03805 [bacterium]|nr:hypothetical protein [bacterium]
MAMIKCKECKKKISSKAKKCPHCGAPVPKKMGCFSGFILIVFIVIVIYYVAVSVSKKPAQKKMVPKKEVKRTPPVQKQVIPKLQVESVGYYKKDNDNGSYTRVFSFYTKSTNFESIKNHAEKQMWSRNGLTVVYYFNDRNNTPDVTFTGNEFNKKYEPYCIAGFWKYTNGKTAFNKYPFKDNSK